MTHEQRQKFIEHKLAEIMEVCDSCQICITVQQEETTDSFHIGAGNFYARYGAVREFITRQDEYIREDARKRANDA